MKKNIGLRIIKKAAENTASRSILTGTTGWLYQPKVDAELKRKINSICK